jgi:hypothetical protein
MPSQMTYAAPTILNTVSAVALAATTAPSPSATSRTWVTRPSPVADHRHQRVSQIDGQGAAQHEEHARHW